MRAWRREWWDLFLLLLVAQAGASVLGWWAITTNARQVLSGAPAGVWAEFAFGSAATWAACVFLTLIACFVLVFRYNHGVRRINTELEAQVGQRVRDATRARDAMIFGLAKLADCRDTDTGLHLDRISTYAGLLAQSVHGSRVETSDRSEPIEEEWISSLCLAASLHDIGKVGIPDAVLLKPGRLTPDERRLIERHPEIGAGTLAAIRDRFGDDPLVDMAHDIALGHHERWDGSGYPMGRSGKETPLSARIVALADVYDALTSNRVYKRAVSHEDACAIIIAGRGTQFDPTVVDAFEDIAEGFRHAAGCMQERTVSDQTKLAA